MTSAPLTFQRQHLCWQQRVGTERKKTLNYHDDDAQHKTFYNNYPSYLEKLDSMKKSTFKNQHPLRFHDKSQPLVENYYDPEKNRTFNATIQPKSTASTAAIATKKNLREILEQNNLYDEVLHQINNRLDMRETVRSGKDSVHSKMSKGSRFRSVGGGQGQRSGQMLPAIRKPGSDLARQVANAIKAPSQARSVTKITQVSQGGPMNGHSRTGSVQQDKQSSQYSKPRNQMIDHLQKQITYEKNQGASLKNRLTMLNMDK